MGGAFHIHKGGGGGEVGEQKKREIKSVQNRLKIMEDHHSSGTIMWVCQWALQVGVSFGCVNLDQFKSVENSL